MATTLERIADKARCEPNLQFTSICHKITKELLWDSLNHIPTNSAKGIDEIDVTDAKKEFGSWSSKMLQAIHNKGYKAPPTRRVLIPKIGTKDMRPIAIPCVSDRALQRSVHVVLSAIYEQDFCKFSFGGRPKVGAHNALATLHEIISGRKISWVLEADLKNFFGSLDHGWLLQFVKHRVGDPRILNLIQRWLKAGVLESNELHHSDIGTPQGGSISVLMSNIYLHYVLDLWFEKVAKPKLKGETYMVRYIDDFVICFQYHSDAVRLQTALSRRLEKFNLKLEPKKTRLIEFGRFADKHAKRSKRKMETLYFLGFTHFCTRNRKGNFMVGRKTEKTRFKRSVMKLQVLIRKIRHFPMKVQNVLINQTLRGHYAYYGLGGNHGCLHRLYILAERYWRKMLSSRSRKSYISWEKFAKLKQIYPLQKPKLKLSFENLKRIAVL